MKTLAYCLAVFLWPAGLSAVAAPAQHQSVIHITFVIHFDPLPAPGGQVPRWAYEAERDNLQWLADYLERIEKQKGIAFVPRLTLEMAGDHAEWYLEDERGLAQRGDNRGRAVAG